MIRSAFISEDGLYRWNLTRDWRDETLALGQGVTSPPSGSLCWVMLNPSTADASDDDPTIRRCISFSQREGYGALEVVNLFAWRATKPAELMHAADPIGWWNDGAIMFALGRASRVVCAWGSSASKVGSCRTVQIPAWAREHDVPVSCLGTTKNGWPRHPLYVRADQPFEEYPR